MKATIQFALFLAAAATAFGQGYITWGNNMTGFRAPIYGFDPANPGLAVTGQTASGTPAGTTVYNGPLLNGTGYTLAFLGGTSAGSLSFITSQPFRSSATGALPAGLVLGGTIIINGVAVGTTFFYQYVAWDNRGGTLTDWASAQQAWQAGTTAAGMSTIQSAVLGGVNPVDGSIVATPNAAGWTSFSIYGGGYPPYPTYFFSGFTTQPANQTVVAGATASFMVAANAYPSPSIQWYSNGAPLTGAYGGTYQITNVQPADAGNYYAVLSNPSWGAYTSASATLTVVSALVTAPPRSQTAETGANAVFSVRADGPGPLSYQWLCNGTNAASGAGTSPDLRLTAVQPAQAGTYTVIVTNAFGAVTSAPAMLSVIPPVERRLVPALWLFGQMGESLDLDTADTLGPPPNWTAFDSVMLTNRPQWYFDFSAPLPPQRFYRAWQTSGSSAVPTLDLHLVPALTLTGAAGNSVRVDYINQFGPTDAWVTLDTVALTNTSQLYFDTSAIGQPPRLWRIVPVP